MNKGAIKFPIHYAPHRSGNMGALVANDAELICIMDSITKDEAECLVKMANAGAEKSPEGKVLVAMSEKLAKVLFEVANVNQLQALLVNGEHQINTRLLRHELEANGVTCTANEAESLCEELFEATQKVLTA